MKLCYFKEKTGLSDSQIVKLRMKGMPCEVVGSRYSYDLSKIDKWAKENKITQLGYKDSELMTIKELRECIGISKKVTDQWTKQGMPYIEERPGLFKARMEDVTKWLGLPEMDRYTVGSLLNTKEILEEFYMYRNTLSRWMQAGMPFYKFGPRIYRYDLEQIEEWLDGNDK